MKKIIALMVSLCLALSATACSSSADDNDGVKKTEVIVFAASSLTETLTEIGEMYMAENEEISIVFNFDSSGKLKTQIEEGAECDVFISAGQKQIDELDFVYEGTRIDLLENKVTLCMADNSKAELTSFDELARKLADGSIMLAMGNEDVPVGQYTGKILDWYGLDEAELAKKGVITYGSNAKEVTTQVSEGTVDCGVLYSTDAFSAGLIPVDYATKEMCGQVIYPATLINTTNCEKEAKAFLEYLTTDAAMAVFGEVGFAKVN